MCKYIAKIDEQKYFLIEIDGKGKLVIKALFLYNKKVASSKMGENKEQIKDDGKVKGRCISQM